MIDKIVRSFPLLVGIIAVLGFPTQVFGRGDTRYDYVQLSFWREGEDNFYKDGFTNTDIPDAHLEPGQEYTFNCGTDRVREVNGDQLQLVWQWNGTVVNGTDIEKRQIGDVYVYETTYTFTATEDYNNTYLACLLLSPQNPGIVTDPIDSVRIITMCASDRAMCADDSGCYIRCDDVNDCADFSDEMGCPVQGLNTTVLHKWYGGFVGLIDFNIFSPTTSWVVTLTFPRKIYKLDVGDAVILDKQDYGFVYHLGNTPCNGYLSPGENLEIMFLADLFDKFKGVRADAIFSYEGPGTPPLNMTDILNGNGNGNGYSNGNGGGNRL